MRMLLLALSPIVAVAVTPLPRALSHTCLAPHHGIAAAVPQNANKRPAAASRVETFRLKNCAATELASMLQRIIRSAVGIGSQKSSALEFLSLDAKNKELIRSGILNDAHVTADEKTNAIIVSAPANCMGLLAALIRELDSPATVAQIMIFRVRHGDATARANMLRSLLPSRGPVPLRLSVDVRTNSIIAIGSARDLITAEALLLRLDVEGESSIDDSAIRRAAAPLCR